MAYHVIISGVYPPIHAMRCETETGARDGLAYLAAMFPHLNDDCLHIWTDPAAFGEAPHGFVRESVQAYLTTGNGYPRQAPGTVTMGNGIHETARERAMGA